LETHVQCFSYFQTFKQLYVPDVNRLPTLSVFLDPYITFNHA